MPLENTHKANEMIGMKDVMILFYRRRILILSWMLAGLMCALAYIKLAPKQYETTALIRMGEYYTAEGKYQYIEKPSAASERIGMPEFITSEIRKICGISEREELNKNLNGRLNTREILAIPGGLEVRIRGKEQLQSLECANALFEKLREVQKSMIEFRLRGHQLLISSYEQEISRLKKQVGSWNDTVAGKAFLSTADRLNRLEGDVTNLKNENLLSQNSPASLIVPISTKDKPVAPKAALILFFSWIISLMMGMVHALFKELQSRQDMK